MSTAGTRLRIIVLGYIVRGPLGGMTWHHLQYVMGLRALGHDVWFLEDSDDYPGCYDPTTHAVTTDPRYGLRYAADVFTRVGAGDRWAYHDAHSSRWHGPAASAAATLCRSADVVLNLSGVNPLRGPLAEVPVRALVDTDPVFTQVRHLTDGIARQRAAAHNVFFTFGEHFGQPGCSIPDDGFAWRPTRQPVVLDAWPVSPPSIDAPFTTVMQWESYRAVAHAGVFYGMKAQSFSDYIDLPRRLGEAPEIALGGATAPRAELADHGWRVRDSVAITRDPWTFQRYLAASVGEFTVAKHGYVESGSGWFSERSANYLATGRAVITQDTGLRHLLPCGRGLLTFGSPDEAIECLRTVRADPKRHGTEARAVAEEFFDARHVLTRLLEACRQSAPARGARALS